MSKTNNCSPPPTAPETGFVLRQTEHGLLALYDLTHVSAKPLLIDFDSASCRNRLRTLSHTGIEARAIGLTKYKLPLHLVDATAGFGQDALSFAAMGCEVTMLERHAGMAALLQNAVKRAGNHPQSPTRRMQIVHADAIDYLASLSMTARPDVIYLDPMYPHRRKSALGVQELRTLRLLVGDDPDAARLLDVARRCARRRVVVKRPRLAELLGEKLPDICFTGRSIRYDVHLVHNQAD